MNSLLPAASKLADDCLKEKKTEVENRYRDDLINANQGKRTSPQGRINHKKGRIIITMNGDSPHKAKEMSV